MSIIKRISDQLAERAGREAAGLLNQKLPPQLAAAAGNAIKGAMKGDAVSPVDVVGALRANLEARLPASARAAIGRVTRNLADQRLGLDALSMVRQVSGTGPADPMVFNTPPDPLGLQGTTPLWGGVSLQRYREMFMASANTPRAFKSLWHIAVSELAYSTAAPEGVGETLNMLACDLQFGPNTIEGDKIKIGAAVIDNVTGTEHVDIALTCYDDARGTIQRWFEGKCDQVAARDGTFGLPAKYLIKMRITQMDTEGTARGDDRLERVYWVRPVSLEVDLSRRAHEFVELPLRFTQFDTILEAS